MDHFPQPFQGCVDSWDLIPGWRAEAAFTLGYLISRRWRDVESALTAVLLVMETLLARQTTEIPRNITKSG